AVAAATCGAAAFLCWLYFHLKRRRLQVGGAAVENLRQRLAAEEPPRPTSSAPLRVNRKALLPLAAILLTVALLVGMVAVVGVSIGLPIEEPVWLLIGSVVLVVVAGSLIWLHAYLKPYPSHLLDELPSEDSDCE